MDMSLHIATKKRTLKLEKLYCERSEVIFIDHHGNSHMEHNDLKFTYLTKSAESHLYIFWNPL